MSPGLSCNGHIAVGGLSTLVFFLLSTAIRQFITLLNIEEGPLTALFTSSMHFNCRLHSHEYSWRNGYQTIMIQLSNLAHGS